MIRVWRRQEANRDPVLAAPGSCTWWQKLHWIGLMLFTYDDRFKAVKQMPRIRLSGRPCFNLQGEVEKKSNILDLSAMADDYVAYVDGLPILIYYE